MPVQRSRLDHHPDPVVAIRPHRHVFSHPDGDVQLGRHLVIHHHVAASGGDRDHGVVVAKNARVQVPDAHLSRFVDETVQ